MKEEKRAPIFFFAPFVSSTMRVEPQWIDYNGHLNMAYYHVLFDRAVDEAFALAGLGPEYLEKYAASFFTAETHTRYYRELNAKDQVRVTLQLVDLDEKRMHYFCELRHASEGWLSASCENMSLHVDMKTRRVVPFPEWIRHDLEIMRASHARLPRPEALGSVIGIPDRDPVEVEVAPLRAIGTRH